ncbi:MAG: hypothetical protein NWR47_05930 [Aestuariivirgaceae bacterium]|nr:hypothetical protein [Aestuariivirgaceae bacterium]
MFAYPEISNFDAFDAVQVSCPARNCPDSAVQEIRSRGNLPLWIGGKVLAELSQNDLVESWSAAVELTPGELSRMCQIAGERLLRAFDDAPEPAPGLSEMVTDAAVLFLLGVRSHGVATPDAIPACTVSFDAEHGRAKMALSA